MWKVVVVAASIVSDRAAFDWGGDDVTAPAAPTTRDPYDVLTSWLAHGAVVLVGLNHPFRFGASLAFPLAAALAPLSIRAIRRFTFAPLIVVLTPIAAAAGVVLGELSAGDHVINATSRVQVIALLFSGIGAFTVILWARGFMPIHRVVMLYGIGGLAHLVQGGYLNWKYGLALPTTFVVLGIVERFGARRLAALATVALGSVGLFFDYRSLFAFALLTAALSLWQHRPWTGPERVRHWLPAIVLVVLSVAVYLSTTALLTKGYLGEMVGARSVEQIETSGSLLAGGRPEYAATMRLVALKPVGYGAGVVPNWDDYRAAKQGLQELNVRLEQKRDRYMFRDEFRLHSIAADLWVRYGWIGVMLAGVLLIALVRSLSFAIAQHEASTPVILAVLLAAWSLAFEPSYSYWLSVCVAVGFVLRERPLRAQGLAPAPGVPVHAGHV